MGETGARPLSAHVWNLRLLGPLGVDRDAVPIELGQPKQVAVLAALALHRGEIVPTDRLVDLLWDGHPPRTASHSVQIYVSGLRKLFGSGAGAPRIETRPPGYRLLVDEGTIDAERFERGLRVGREHLRAGDPSAAAEALRAALALWHGEPLADLAYAAFAQPHINRLGEIHRETVGELVAAELAAGYPAEALARAESLVADDPLRDRSVELWMLALYRSGRHVQALRAFARHREDLADIGLTPSPSLARLNEQVLLHDPALMAGAGRHVDRLGSPVRNPFKGLRPFREEDAADFFGREALVDQMIDRLRGGARLVAIVGPSGSGKSSAVAAGLLPRLRSGAVPGSERWLIASLVPARHPLAETEALLARASVPGGLLGHPRALRATTGPVLLVIDQFEELFMACEAESRDAYLDVLTDTLSDAHRQLTVVVTLRADHYDRPLLHPRFAGVFAASVLNALPMTPAELNAAVVGPAGGAGLEVDAELVAEVVADTVSHPGSLPLLQYALADQVDRSGGRTLSLADYRANGGVRAALARRADDVFDALGPQQQRIATRLFLRLVRVGRSGVEGCRTVPVGELTELGVDPVALSDVLEQFVRHRLLVIGADPVTDRPSVGVAHEALVEEWPRMAPWIDRHRDALRRHEALRSAAIEWETADRNDDYLVGGTRLDDARSVADDATLLVSATERDFVAASIARADELIAAEAARHRSRRLLEQRARRRLIGLTAVCALLAGGIWLAVATWARSEPPRRAVLYYSPSGEIGGLVAAGFDAAMSDFGFTSTKVDMGQTEPSSLAEEVDSEHDDVVVMFPVFSAVTAVFAARPGTRLVAIDGVVPGPNVTAVTFGANEGAYLAGAAAALRSRTGTIGFVGGADVESIWEFQAGYEAGARAVEPAVRILSTYLADATRFDAGFLDPDAGQRAATTMYGQGADVIFSAAGSSGLGVFEAASELSQPDRKLWAIGVDSDQYTTVARLPGAVHYQAWRDHILTSVVKRFDRGIYAAVQQVVENGPPEAIHLGLADGGVDLAYSGGHIDDLRAQLEVIREDIVAGRIVVPCSPSGREPTHDARDVCSPGSLTP